MSVIPEPDVCSSPPTQHTRLRGVDPSSGSRGVSAVILSVDSWIDPPKLQPTLNLVLFFFTLHTRPWLGGRAAERSAQAAALFSLMEEAHGGLVLRDLRRSGGLGLQIKCLPCKKIGSEHKCPVPT